MRIAIDLMGSDSSPQVLFDTALKVEKELAPHQSLLLLVEEGVLQNALSTPKIEILFVKESIGMDENPLLAARRKKESSMAVGLRLLAEKKVDAFVSGGNTGALMALSILNLPLLSYIERPALLVELPTELGSVVVLDVGANLICKPQNLVQFAILGTRYQQISRGLNRPKVALLNIGTESEKGTAELRQTYQELQDYCSQHSDIEFVGNIEGPEVFRGKVDVLVTDGFTGNVFLKTSEGVTSFIVNHLERNFPGNPVISHLNSYLNYSQYFGAVLAGLDGLVIKVHGGSSPQAFFSGIKGALRLADENLISRLKV